MFRTTCTSRTGRKAIVCESFSWTGELHIIRETRSVYTGPRPARMEGKMPIAVKALSSKFTAVERARSRFISESFESKLNYDSSSEREMILKQKLDV